MNLKTPEVTEPDNTGTFAAWINTLRPLKVTDNTLAAWINTFGLRTKMNLDVGCTRLE